MIHDVAAAARLAEVEQTLDDTYLAWYGPRVVIEDAPQGMGGDPTCRIHGIYRDPENDYGTLITG